MICPANIRFDEAIAILRKEAQPLGIETTRLAKAGRRVLAEPVIARIDAPRFDAAAMDGFALRSGAPPGKEEYRIVGAAYPGAPWGGIIGDGEAVRIMTGAAVPPGADRVVPIELATIREGIVCFDDDWPRRTHIRSRGSDVQTGRVVLDAGTMLDPRGLLVAAAADVATVRTWRRPVVTVIASGDELTPPGTASEAAATVPDSLSEALLLLARQYDAKLGDAFLVRYAQDAIRAAAETALPECDVLVLVGGASRGDRDFAKSGLHPLGLDVRFAEVAMKPGRPVWYGRIGETHVLGLPGNPTAALTAARLFLVPLLRALGGRDLLGALAWRSTPLLAAADPAGPRESFLCGTLTEAGVEIIERQSASSQLMLARANGLVRLLPDRPALAAGDLVQVLGF